MDERSVQRTGNSSYTVSIPKEWADANGIDSESTLRVTASDERLILSADPDERVRREIDIGLLDTEEVRGALVGMYENGVDEIVLVADQIRTDQRRTIQETTKTLLGAELLEETGTRVVVESIIERGSLTLQESLNRMRSLALTMLKEALHALGTGDADLTRGIVERDEEADRLWSFMSRRVRTTLHTSVGAEDRPLDQRRRLNYYETGRQLERIADTATDIARAAPGSWPDGSATAFESLGEDVVSATEAVVEAITSEDPDRARELLRQYRAHVGDVEATMPSVENPKSADGADASGDSILALVRQCVGYTRNLAAIAQHGIYSP